MSPPIGTLVPSVDRFADPVRPVWVRDGDLLRARCRSELDSLRAALDATGLLLDEARAWMTVPLGTDAADPRRSPGVDMATWTLHVRYERTRDRETLGALVLEYHPYAASLTQRLVRHGEAYEDLLQVSMEALVAALQRFECARRTPFPAFARPTIVGAVKRHYRDHGWSIRMPRSVHEVAPAAREAHERLTVELAREPTTREVADEIGVDRTVVEATRVATRARAVTSLDTPAVEGGPSLAEVLGSEDGELERAESRAALTTAVATLSSQEREVLRLYFFEELSQTVIAERFGVSQMQVSRWLSRILARLRARMGAG